MTATKTTSKRKTLVFHIGDHKTGSTSIQYAFARGAVTLKGRKLLYPAKLGHNYLREPARVLFSEAPAKKQAAAEDSFRKLAERIRRSDADLILLSAEEFDNVPATQLHQLIKTWFADAVDDIRVVSYVRPHAPRLVSSFATQTKSGVFNEGSLTDFHNRLLERDRLLYHPRFSALRDTFGEGFILRPMIRSQLFTGDVVHDFIRYGLGADNFDVAPFPIANETLCIEDMMRLKLLQRHHQHLGKNLRHALGWEFTRQLDSLLTPATRNRLQLHKSLASEIRQAYLEDARAMDHDFFGGNPLLKTDLDRAVSEAIETAQSVEPEDHFSNSEIRSLTVLSQLVAELMGQKGVNWHKELRSRRLSSLE